MQNSISEASNTIEKIKSYASGFFLDWLNNWSLHENDFIVSVAYKQVVNIKNYQVCALGNSFFLISDSYFDWGKVIFGETLIELPAKTNLAELIASSKNDMINSFLKTDLWTHADKYTPPTHYNFYVSINIQLKNQEKVRFLVPLYCVSKIFNLAIIASRKKFLTKRTDVLAGKKCDLSIKLNFGEFSVEELSSLAAGSILCPDLLLDNRFLLESNNIQLANVAVGQISERKAFMINEVKK